MQPYDIARRYLDLGLCVLPAGVGRKSPTIKWKGLTYDDAKANAEEWFDDTDESNYWVLCGATSNVVVVDIDSAGAEEWLRNEVGDEILDQCWVAKTVKGHHYWFRYPAVGKLRSWAIHDGEIEVDVRADGGGVIVPPSSHPSGARYRWVRSPRDHGEPPVLPAAIYARKKAVRSREGNGRPGRPKGLDTLLNQPPPSGGRNDWLTKISGYYARIYSDDRARFGRAIRKANTVLDSPLDEFEVKKIIESIWTSEQAKAKEKEGEPGSGLHGDGTKLWVESKDGPVEWADFDMRCETIAYDHELGMTYYNVRLTGVHAIEGHYVLDSKTLSNLVTLRKWLSGRRASLSGAFGNISVEARLQRYLLGQSPRELPVLRAFGWDADLQRFITPDDDDVIVVTKQAEFKYGRDAGIEEARHVLREVLTFQDSMVASVFGAWWAAVWLKGHLERHTALFPMMVVQGPSGSGKTTGFFAMMSQLNGSEIGPGVSTPASFRNRLSAHSNGIVWIDDVSSLGTGRLEILRLLSSQGSTTKMGVDNQDYELHRLVAPVVISGEGIDSLVGSKAYLERSIGLEVPVPAGRMSERRPDRTQWDDIVELWDRYDRDLTRLAGCMLDLAMEQAHWADKLPEARAAAPGRGRQADKLAILLIGAKVLSAMTQDPAHYQRVKAWVAGSGQTPTQDALVIEILPILWAQSGSPKQAWSRVGHPNPVWKYDDASGGWWHLNTTANTWREYATRLRIFEERIHGRSAIERQGRQAGLVVTRGSQKRWPLPIRKYRKFFHPIPAAVWAEIEERA